MDPDDFTCPPGLHHADKCNTVRKVPFMTPPRRPVTVGKIVLNDENVEKGKAAVREAFDAGRESVIGDHSDMGHLYMILTSMGIEFTTE